MAKKNTQDMTVDELRAELKAEQDKTSALSAQKAEVDEALKVAKAIEKKAAQNDDGQLTEEQWAAAEKKFGMEREELERALAFHKAVSAPLYAKIHDADVERAAERNMATLTEKVKDKDREYPKYALHVKEFLADVSKADLADPAKAEKVMEKAVLFARGKARSLGGDNPGGNFEDRSAQGAGDGDANPNEHWGEVRTNFAPLTFMLEKLVPDEYRKLHKHPDPEQPGAVQINEKADWKAGIPQRAGTAA